MLLFLFEGLKLFDASRLKFLTISNPQTFK
jgi:hypothetical protein